MKKIIPFLILIIFTLTACATNTCSVKYKFDRYPVATEAPCLPEGKARIFLYRPDAIPGCMIRPPIFLNDKPIGQSIPGTIFFIDVAAGKYYLHIPLTKYSTVVGFLGGGLLAAAIGPHYETGKEKIINIKLINKEVAYIKNWVSFNISGRTNLEIISQDQAKKEIKDLKLICFKIND